MNKPYNYDKPKHDPHKIKGETLQYPILPICKHSYNHNTVPRYRNCQYCWITFFQNHGEVVQTADEIFTLNGPDLIAHLQGKKFLKMFLRFMASIEHIKEQGKAL